MCLSLKTLLITSLLTPRTSLFLTLSHLLSPTFLMSLSTCHYAPTSTTVLLDPCFQALTSSSSSHVDVAIINAYGLPMPALDSLGGYPLSCQNSPRDHYPPTRNCESVNIIYALAISSFISILHSLRKLSLILRQHNFQNGNML